MVGTGLRHFVEVAGDRAQSRERVRQLGGGTGDRGAVRSRAALDDGDEQLVLAAWKVVVEARLANAHGVRHRLERHGGVAAGDQQAIGVPDRAFAGARRVDIGLVVHHDHRRKS